MLISCVQAAHVPQQCGTIINPQKEYFDGYWPENEVTMVDFVPLEGGDCSDFRESREKVLFGDRSIMRPYIYFVLYPRMYMNRNKKIGSTNQNYLVLDILTIQIVSIERFRINVYQHFYYFIVVVQISINELIMSYDSIVVLFWH